MTNFEIIDAVQRSLESEGLLQSIRAQLRAGVFRIISDGPDYVPKVNKVETFTQNVSGKQSLLLVKNLLETLGLTQSLSVFLAETGLEEDSAAHYGLAKQLNLGVPSSTQPILERLVIVHETHKHSANNSPDAKPSRYDSANNDSKSFNDSKSSGSSSRFEESKSLSPNKSLNISTNVYQPSGVSSAGNSPKIANATSYDFNEVPRDDDDDEVPDEINESLAGSEEDDTPSPKKPYEQPLQQQFSRQSPPASAESKAVSSSSKQDSPKKGYFDDEADEDEDEQEESQLSVADSPDASKNNSATSFLGGKKAAPSVFNSRLDDSFEKSGSVETSPVPLSKQNSAGKLDPMTTTSKAALPPLQKAKPVNMDISSSFEPDASTNSVKNTASTSAVKSPPKRAETKSPEPEEIEDEESEGPEVDEDEDDSQNTSEEVDQLAESEGKLKFREAMQYAESSSPRDQEAKGSAASERRIEVKGKLDPLLPAPTASALEPVSTNKARVNRMAQSSVSRSTKGWNVSQENDDDEADREDEDDNVDQLSESFNKRHESGMDVRDLSDDHIEEHKSSPMAKYDRKQVSTGPSGMTSSSGGAASSSAKATSAWGNNSSSRFGSASSNSNKKPQLDASFEEDEDADDRNPVHTSYRSNQDEDEEDDDDHNHNRGGGVGKRGHNDSDEVVLEQSEDDEEYSEEHSGYNFSHGTKSNKKEQEAAPQAFVRRTEAPAVDKSVEEEEEEEEQDEDYGDEDFEDDDADRSNQNIKPQSRTPAAAAAAPAAASKKPEVPAHDEEEEYEDDIVEEIEEEEMSVGQNSDEESGDDGTKGKQQQQQKSSGSSSLFNKPTLGRGGPSGALPGINSRSGSSSAAAPSHNANRYFDNNSDEDEEEEGDGSLNNTAEITKRMTDIDRKLASMEKSDSTLVNLRKNIDSGNDASEVISESMSVASEDIDVMEFSAGGDHPESDDGF